MQNLYLIWFTLDLLDVFGKNDVTATLKILSNSNIELNKLLDDHRTTFLHREACCKDACICEYVLRRGVNLNIDTKSNFGATPLHYVARCNRETCRPLLQFNADINSVTNEEFTPNQKAVISCCYNVCRILCENKMINVNWQNKNKETALHLAVFHRVRQYADPNDPYKPYVCDDDYMLMVKELLQRGASANIQDSSGDTALHVSATYEMDYIAKQLLHHNEDVHTRNNSDKTALEIAEKNEYRHVRNLLKNNERKSKKKKNKLYGSLLWMGFNCLKARANSRRQFTFYH